MDPSSQSLAHTGHEPIAALRHEQGALDEIGDDHERYGCVAGTADDMQARRRDQPEYLVHPAVAAPNTTQGHTTVMGNASACCIAIRPPANLLHATAPRNSGNHTSSVRYRTDGSEARE